MQLIPKEFYEAIRNQAQILSPAFYVLLTAQNGGTSTSSDWLQNFCYRLTLTPFIVLYPLNYSCHFEKSSREHWVNWKPVFHWSVRKELKQRYYNHNNSSWNFNTKPQTQTFPNARGNIQVNPHSHIMIYLFAWTGQANSPSSGCIWTFQSVSSISSKFSICWQIRALRLAPIFATVMLSFPGLWLRRNYLLISTESETSKILSAKLYLGTSSGWI